MKYSEIEVFLKGWNGIFLIDFIKTQQEMEQKMGKIKKATVIRGYP